MAVDGEGQGLVPCPILFLEKDVFFLKVNVKKRVLPLLVALALALSCSAGLFVSVHATTEYVDFLTSSYSSVNSSSQNLYYYFLNSCSNADYSYSVLINLPSDCVALTSFSTTGQYYGVYIGDLGQLVLGVFSRSGDSGSYQYLGVHYLSDLVLLSSYDLWLSSSSCLVFLSVDDAISYSTSGGSAYHLVSGSGSNFYLNYYYDGAFSSSSTTKYFNNSCPAPSSLRIMVNISFLTEYRFVELHVPTLEVYNYSTSLLYPGLSQGYNVALDGVDLTADEILDQITWSLSGNSSVSTVINEYGVLTIGPDETASAVTVTATLRDDISVSGNIAVSITPLPDAVDLTLLPEQTQYTAGQPYYVKYYLAFNDGTKFDYDGFVWAVDTPDTAVSINSGGYLYITSESAIGSFELTVSYPWDDAPLKSAYIQLVDPNGGSSGSSGSGGSDSSGSGSSGSSGSVDMTETNEKLDDIISGDSGVDVSDTDFSDVADSFNSSLGDVNNSISAGSSHISNFVSSASMGSTLSVLASGLGSAFSGNEITICGITANPFDLAVVCFGSMALIALVTNYIFRKRGGK